MLATKFRPIFVLYEPTSTNLVSAKHHDTYRPTVQNNYYCVVLNVYANDRSSTEITLYSRSRDHPRSPHDTSGLFYTCIA